MREFVIGDIHGEYEKLETVLKMCKFDFENDKLYTLGDIVDRGENPIKCFEHLLKIKNRIDIRGNHDDFFLHWIKTGVDFFRGNHGVKETQKDWFKCKNQKLKNQIIQFLENQKNYFIDDLNRLFVHGGISTESKIEVQDSSLFFWDRLMLENAMFNNHVEFPNRFNEVFIGHTPTINYIKNGNIFDYPILVANKIYMMDTGAPFPKGKLTIMNVNSKEFYQA